MPVSLQSLASKFDCELVGDGDLQIDGVCTLQNGKPNAITFLANRKYKQYLSSTMASAVILKKEDVADCPKAALVSINPYASYARIAAYLTQNDRYHQDGIHVTAQIADTAQLGNNVTVGSHTVIEDNVKVGDGSYIGPGCVISNGTTIGENCYLHSNITIYSSSVLGNNVLVHAGVVIGADGFGIAQDQGQWVKVPQLGRVLIGNDVEIGASTTIDRGAIEDTIIEEGVKLDNQIQVGHNVKIGAHTAVAGCVGIAGSAIIGERCTIAAMTLVLGHLELADDVHITAQSMVTKSIKEPGVYSSGTPLEKNAQWKRNYTRYSQLDDLAKRIKKLEKLIDKTKT